MRGANGPLVALLAACDALVWSVQWCLPVSTMSGSGRCREACSRASHCSRHVLRCEHLGDSYPLIRPLTHLTQPSPQPPPDGTPQPPPPIAPVSPPREMECMCL
jgi:hypothetical protein